MRKEKAGGLPVPQADREDGTYDEAEEEEVMVCAVQTKTLEVPVYVDLHNGFMMQSGGIGGYRVYCQIYGTGNLETIYNW